MVREGVTDGQLAGGKTCWSDCLSAVGENTHLFEYERFLIFRRGIPHTPGLAPARTPAPTLPPRSLDALPFL